jgi:hypothetical protein
MTVFGTATEESKVWFTRENVVDRLKASRDRAPQAIAGSVPILRHPGEINV